MLKGSGEGICKGYKYPIFTDSGPTSSKSMVLERETSNIGYLESPGFAVAKDTSLLDARAAKNIAVRGRSAGGFEIRASSSTRAGALGTALIPTQMLEPQPCHDTRA